MKSRDHPTDVLVVGSGGGGMTAALITQDLGTKGGLCTDACARVLGQDGSPIEGLYVTGNCSASVMGEAYPGAGSTIGPAMTFGSVAACHAPEQQDTHLAR